MGAKRQVFLELLYIWTGTLVIAFALRFVFTNGSGFTLTTPTRTVYLSSSQFAFRASILLGLLTSSVLLVRAVRK